MNAPSPIPIRADTGAIRRRNVAAFVRVCIAGAIAKLEMRHDERAILKERWPDDSIAPLILRAATSPASLSGTPALAATIMSDIVSTLGATSAGTRLLQSGLQLTFDQYAAITVPALEAKATQAGFVQEGAPIPVHNLVSKSASLAPRKIALITALSREMMESSNAEALVTDALLRSIGLALDSALFDATAGDTIRPAGLRAGIPALAASTLTVPDDAMVADLTTISGAVAALGGDPIFVVAPARAITIQLRARRPFPYAVLASPAVSPADVIAVAGVGLASALDDVPEIDISKTTALHEEDTTPLPIGTPGSPNTVAAPTRSLMQTDAVGIRLRFDCDWTLRDTRAVAWTTATGW